MAAQRRKKKKSPSMLPVVLLMLAALALIAVGIGMIVGNMLSGNAPESSAPTSVVASEESEEPTESVESVESGGASPTLSTQEPTTTTTILTTTTIPTTVPTKVNTADHYVQPEGSPWYLVLANAWNPLPSDYDDRITLTEIDSGKAFDSRAVGALQELLQAGSTYGLWGASLHRSVALQESLYEREVQEWLNMGYSQAEAEANAATEVARPGTSEHNTGLAVDVLATGYSSLTESFAQSEAYAWLIEHCAEYGFILRFPQGREDITGVIFEPWHYRYVGVEAATEIMSRGLTLEEYLEEKGI